eukprot:gnl/TRDRNA2_/TRDRNA2_179550_c0_seq1.p1 gnl/TRDRNA2_/TRDRNA2_179550_c0~~gnl/TRDRNA2_/TRDRNA2_179550_c0_seq1.p1  ORF type:complete len:283 (+),score=35.62 gnl/TRDRNA2_/TRDRNA2_179550_c0_seq1:91-849(+)
MAATKPRTSSPAQRKEPAKVASPTATTAAPSSGIPEINPRGFRIMALLLLPLMVVPRLVGGAITLAIFKYGKTALYKKNMTTLEDGEQGYLYLASFVFALVVTFLNNYPMCYKSMCMRIDSGNLRANMMIYKQAGAQAGAPYTILETEGPVGSYNRANRSLTHFTENSISTALCILLAGRVFPFPTFILTAVFALGRVVHQVGYAAKGYGGHGAGFAIAMLASSVLETICLYAGLKSLHMLPATVFYGRLEL